MMLIFRSWPAAPILEVMQPLMTPFIEVNLRAELERDLSDLAGWGQGAQCGVAPRRTKGARASESLDDRQRRVRPRDACSVVP
jgi:hypothetical protein